MNFRTLSNLGVDAPEWLNRHLSFVFLQRKNLSNLQEKVYN